MSWTIRHDGTAYAVETGADTRVSRLLADGQEVDSGTAGYWESSTLTHGDTTIEVRWGPRNQITSAALVEPGNMKTPLTPPPGSRAAAREALQREHPARFVLRRTVVAVVEIVIGVLGIGALVAAFFGSLLPRIPKPSLPDWLPEMSAPDWLRYLDPVHWLGRLGLSWPHVEVPGWIEAVLEQKKYWLPIVVAVLVALGELERRRKIDAAREAERDESDETT